MVKKAPLSFIPKVENKNQKEVLIKDIVTKFYPIHSVKMEDE